MSWFDPYRSKLITAREAVQCVQSGMRVYIHPGCAEPEALVEALMDRAGYVKNVEIVHLLTLGTSPYCLPEMSESFRHNALFVGGNVREAVQQGRAARLARLLQFWRRRRYHFNCREIRAPCCRSGKCADAAHIW